MPRTPRPSPRPSILSVITRLARGGSERRLFDVLDAVPAEHTIVVGGGSDPGQVADLAARHTVVELPELVRQVEQAADARAVRALVRLARSGGFDVMHTHQAKAGLLGRVAARAARVPVVYHSASMASFGPGYGRLESEVFARAERLTAPLVSRYFVVGADLARRLAANGVPPARLQVVRSSQRLAAFTAATAQDKAELRVRAGVRPDAPVVCFVGSLEERKGILHLVDLVRRAAPDGPVTLLVAGEGPLRARLERDAAEAGPDLEVVLLGHVADVPSVMRAADVLVLPSSAEGLPQVLVQAAHADVPFVAFDVDGVAELVGAGARGRSVPLGDLETFARSLGDELSMAVAGHRSGPGVERSLWTAWDPETVGQRYREAYDSDLRSATAARRAGALVAQERLDGS